MGALISRRNALKRPFSIYRGTFGRQDSDFRDVLDELCQIYIPNKIYELKAKFFLILLNPKHLVQCSLQDVLISVWHCPIFCDFSFSSKDWFEPVISQGIFCAFGCLTEARADCIIQLSQPYKIVWRISPNYHVKNEKWQFSQ